jgi:hypothetical protein
MVYVVFLYEMDLYYTTIVDYLTVQRATQRLKEYRNVLEAGRKFQQECLGTLTNALHGRTKNLLRICVMDLQ